MIPAMTDKSQERGNIDVSRAGDLARGWQVPKTLVLRTPLFDEVLEKFLLPALNQCENRRSDLLPGVSHEVFGDGPDGSQVILGTSIFSNFSEESDNASYGITGGRRNLFYIRVEIFYGP